MNLSFKYRQKYFAKIIVLILFILIPNVLINDQIYFSISYYVYFILIQLVIHLYFAAKKLIITDEGVTFQMLPGLNWNSVEWSAMEEAHEIRSKGYSKNSLQSIMEPFAVINWIAGLNRGTTIKIIVENDSPLYIELNDFKKGFDLKKILKEKLRFIK